MSVGIQSHLDNRVTAPPTGAIPKLPFLWIGSIIFLVELVAIVSLSVITGVVYNEVFLHTLGDIETFIAVGVASFLYYAIAFAYRGNYSIANLSSQWRQAREVTVVWGMVVLFLFGLAFLLKIGPNFSRVATSAFFALGWALLVSWRLFLAQLVASAREAGIFAEREVIVVGERQLLGQSNFLQDLHACGYRAVSVVNVAESTPDIDLQKAIKTSRENAKIDGIFLVMDWERTDQINQIVEQLSVVPLPVRLLPDPNVARFLNKPVVQVGQLWAAELQRGPLTVQERFVKRVFDIAVAAITLVAHLPLMMIVALLIKLDSRGPVFFMQTRTGFNDRPFRIFKFRTLMTLEDGPVVPQVKRNDPRLTRIGRLLRRTSMDELPQLLNVLRGEMSLVGPRPHATAHNSQFEQLIGNYAFRHHVKPGLTGWAQVNGFRGETTLELMKRRVDFDLWYIDHWSLWLDIKIAAETLLVLLRQPAAY